MENRRVNERFVLHQLIEIVYTKEETFYNANTLDISAGGLRCQVKYPITTGAEIYLMFEIKEDDESHLIKCYGETTWVTKEDEHFIIGIKFKDLDEEDRVILDNYSQSLEPI